MINKDYTLPNSFLLEINKNLPRDRDIKAIKNDILQLIQDSFIHIDPQLDLEEQLQTNRNALILSTSKILAKYEDHSFLAKYIKDYIAFIQDHYLSFSKYVNQISEAGLKGYSSIRNNINLFISFLIYI